MTVYSYGRYAGVDKYSGVTLGRFSPTGPGVLVRMTGNKATDFVSKELKDNKAEAFEFPNADQNKTVTYMDLMWKSSTEIPDVGVYKGDADAHIIDKYSLLSNNCVTKSEAGANAGGAEQSFITTNECAIGQDIPPGAIQSNVITPSDLQDYLKDQSKNKSSGVKNVTRQATGEVGTGTKATTAPNSSGGN